MLADDLVRGVALEALGAGVPALDPPGAVEHVEGVVAHAVDEQAEPPLRRLRVVSRALLGPEEPRPADGGRDPVRHQLEEAGVVRGEAARGQAADVDDADPAAVEHQRGTEQGVEPLGPEDRAHHLRLADVLDDHRDAAGRDRAGDPAPERDPHVEPHFLFEAVRRAHGQLRPLVVEQEDDDRVGGHGLPDPSEELREEVVQPQVREGRVRHALHGPDLVRRRLERPARPLLAGGQGLRARLRTAENAAHDADDQRLQREDPEAGDDRRAQRGAVGSRPHERPHPDERPHEGGQEPGPEPSVPCAEHDRAEIEREIAPVDVRLERVGQEPGDAGGRRGEQVLAGGLPGRARRRPRAGRRRRSYRGT